MSIAPQSLTFSATQGQGNPAAQSVAIANCGPAVAWSASAATTDGANWLTINTAPANLPTNTSDNVSIAVSGAGLQVGTYAGQVTFTMGSAAQTVSVSFTIVQQQPKPCLQVSTATLPFTATQGRGDPAPQTVTLTNCGPDGSWSARAANGSSWLATSPTSSTLGAGTSQSVTVSTSIAGLGAGTYKDAITFTLTNSAGTAKLPVAITLTVLPAPCLSITSTTPQASSGVIYVYAGSTASVTLSNCGSDTGTLSSAVGTSWLTDDLSQGSSMAPGGTQTVTISTASSAPPGGTGTLTMTLKTRGGKTSVTITIGILSPIQ